MKDLVKVRDVSVKYGVSARALKYYEDAGLLTSTKSDDYAYRLYDEAAVTKLEQILILRKLNISVKDIKRIFGTSGSEAVLEVLGKKVADIDGEVALLNELKEIIMEFIGHIRQADFSKGADVKMLYEKTKDIEGQLVNVDYNGNPAPSKASRLLEITEKLDKKVPDIMVVRIPKFRAVTTGIQTWEDMFKEGGGMCQLWQHSHLFREIIFECPDFLIGRGNKAEWLCAVKDGVSEADTAPLRIIDFEGGLYALAVSIDGDDESLHNVGGKIRKWIEKTNFVHDESRGDMGNMTYCDDEIKKGLGYEQLQRYIPIKLKEGV
jgi:DNA-binding transcriptional MerR regulator